MPCVVTSLRRALTREASTLLSIEIAPGEREMLERVPESGAGWIDGATGGRAARVKELVQFRQRGRERARHVVLGLRGLHELEDRSLVAAVDGRVDLRLRQRR